MDVTNSGSHQDFRNFAGLLGSKSAMLACIGIYNIWRELSISKFIVTIPFQYVLVSHGSGINPRYPHSIRVPSSEWLQLEETKWARAHNKTHDMGVSGRATLYPRIDQDLIINCEDNGGPEHSLDPHVDLVTPKDRTSFRWLSEPFWVSYIRAKLKSLSFTLPTFDILFLNFNAEGDFAFTSRRWRENQSLKVEMDSVPDDDCQGDFDDWEKWWVLWARYETCNHKSVSSSRGRWLGGPFVGFANELSPPGKASLVNNYV
ncbi:hypothetical protein F5146DRAFT_999291 [Armillaria mellea]|nr:hypothetical protein F5146DRAFT_999291 [Armillaria mellea]